MKLKVVILTATVVAVTGACAPSAPAGLTQAPPLTTIETTPASRGLHLRAAFDRDASVYVGRFVPRDSIGADLDENRALKTVCSEHFHAREVAVNQEMDELVSLSNAASASLGIFTGTAGGNGTATATNGKMARVHYTITKKIQVDADARALEACCNQHPGACTDRVVGEFLRGTGEIYEATSTARDLSGGGGIPAASLHASYKDESQWKRSNSFEDVYFAFLPVASGAPDPGSQSSCDFCTHLPDDPSGLFFCGVSPPLFDEASGREAAMRSARSQVVKFLGERIETRTDTLSSGAQGLVRSETFTSALARGVASQVKDQRYCSETENSPEKRSVYRVLAYVPNTALAQAADRALDDVSTQHPLAASDRAAVKKAVSK